MFYNTVEFNSTVTLGELHLEDVMLRRVSRELTTKAAHLCRDYRKPTI